MENALTKIKEAIERLDSTELRRISYKMYAEIAKCNIMGNYSRATQLEYVRAMVEDELIIREVKEM